MRLVKYLSSSGMCSRRVAAEKIKSGLILVNSRVCSDPAYLVTPDDQVTCRDGSSIKPQQTKIYLMMHKPLGCISAVSSPHGEATVIEYLPDQYKMYNLFPVGRLDKQTTGLLLVTNDGDFAYRLTHPKFEYSKQYLVAVSPQFTNAHRMQLLNGVILEDGKAACDELIIERGQKLVRVILHSGKNRIIRRMFGHLGYTVLALHREKIAHLVLADLPVGACRELSAAELELFTHHL